MTSPSSSPHTVNICKLVATCVRSSTHTHIALSLTPSGRSEQQTCYDMYTVNAGCNLLDDVLVLLSSSRRWVESWYYHLCVYPSIYFYRIRISPCESLHCSNKWTPSVCFISLEAWRKYTLLFPLLIIVLKSIHIDFWTSIILCYVIFSMIWSEGVYLYRPISIIRKLKKSKLNAMFLKYLTISLNPSTCFVPWTDMYDISASQRM